MEANRVEFKFIKEVDFFQVAYLAAVAITAAEALTPVENHDGTPLVKFNHSTRRGLFDVTEQVGQDAFAIFRRFVELNFTGCAFSFTPSSESKPEPMAPSLGERRIYPTL